MTKKLLSFLIAALLIASLASTSFAAYADSAAKPKGVERVEFHDIEVREGFDCIWMESEYWMYEYYPSYTVYMKDGTAIESDYGNVVIGDNYYYAETDDYQNYACWDVGPHEAKGYLFGEEYDFTVTVTPNPYTKLEIEDTAFEDGMPALLMKFSGDGVYKEYTCSVSHPTFYSGGNMMGVELYTTDEESFFCTFTFKYGTIGMPVFDTNLTARVGSLRSNYSDSKFLKIAVFSVELAHSTLFFHGAEPDVTQITRDDTDLAVQIALNTMYDYLEMAEFEETDDGERIVAGRRLAEVCTKQVFGFSPDLHESRWYDGVTDSVSVPFVDWDDSPYYSFSYGLKKTAEGYELRVFADRHAVGEDGGIYTERVDCACTVYLDGDFCVVKIEFNTAPVFIRGDVDGDCSITMKDVLALRKLIAGAAEEDGSAGADVNGDGDVNMKDVLALRKILAGDE